MVNSSIRYGASTRKLASALKAQKISRYKCEVCGRREVKRVGSGIWRCRHCGTVYAGGAYSFTTPSGESARAMVNNLANRK